MNVCSTGHQHLDGNVVVTSAHEQQAVKSPPVMNSVLQNRLICTNIHSLNSLNGKLSAKRLSGLQTQCPIRLQISYIEVFCLHFIAIYNVNELQPAADDRQNIFLHNTSQYSIPTMHYTVKHRPSLI